MTPADTGAEPTIDLRIADAKWVCRRLQARVEHARQRLAELEARTSETDTAFATHLGDGIVDAQSRIACEKADARRTAAAFMADAELESRRRLDVARAEAEALLVVARWLRSQGISPSEAGSTVPAGFDQDVAANRVEAGARRR